MLKLIRKYKSNKLKSELTELGLLDDRNKTLWNEINSNILISYIFSNYPNYAVDSAGNKSKIIIPEHNLDIDSFTNELLHIYLKSKKVFVVSSIENSIASDQVLSKLLSYDLVDHIGNCVDHIKMLPIYLQLGFKAEKFIVDDNENKLTWEELSDIKSCYKISNKYNAKAVDYFIGKYISVKADPNQMDHYSDILIELEKIDSDLFNILERLIGDWIKMPVVNKNPLDDTYHSVIFRLIDGLKEWKCNKQFIFN